jgi:UDP:flavonoid glycosyltransferase YjiC (YdhE family)
MVVYPLFADQGANARCVAAAGAGIEVAALGENATAANRGVESGDPEAVRQAVTRILADPGFRGRSARVAAAMGDLPTLEATFDDVIER